MLDFYNPQRLDFFLTGVTKWWWLPDEQGGRTLVISVKSSQVTLWVVAYTMLVTLIFMAACELATAIILTTFRLGNSGTRHAILVAYYNGGSPSRTLRPMLGYLRNSLWRCRKLGEWAVDWDAFWPSFGLLLLAVTLLCGDIVTKFFLGGTGLIIANVAQANPNAVFYPSIDITNTSITNVTVPALKSRVSEAIYQARGRMTSAEQRLGDRIEVHSEYTPKGVLLPDGRRQNGAGARFEYQYSLSGYEMGLRDAPELEYKVRGTCGTNYEVYIISAMSVDSSGDKSDPNVMDIYPYFEDSNPKNSTYVAISAERGSAPWAQFVIRSDEETRKQNEQYGGYRFMIVPHTAWRPSAESKTGLDPWYETEANPDFEADSDLNSQYRIKSGRPALRCTQNDTYTYKGNTVDHVNKLAELPGLNSTLSHFIMQIVFRQEFGVPVLSRILGTVPVGMLASNTFFDAGSRLLDVNGVTIIDDFRGLVTMGFLYSREVVRNTVFLYSVLPGLKDAGVRNAAQTVNIARNADFFLEGNEVTAMSVFVVVVTPSVCLFLWLLLLVWHTCFNPDSVLDNKSALFFFLVNQYQ